MAEIVMYTTSWCGYCHRARGLLAEKGQTWTEIDIEEQPEQREVMIERAQRTSVPQIFIDGKHVGGYDDMAELERQGRLDPLLAGQAEAG